MNKKYALSHLLFIAFLFSIPSIAIGQDDEIGNFPMGIREGDEAILEEMPQKAQLMRSLYDSANLPAAISLKSFAPYPASQSNYGTCTAWAVSYAARTILEAQRHDWHDRDTITANAFTPAFTYRRVEPDNDNCYGAFTASAVNSLKEDGALPLKYWKDPNPEDEFHCPNDIDPSLLDIAANYKITDYARLFNESKSRDFKTDRVKLSLSNGNPVVISMKCPKSFHKMTGEVWEPTENDEYGKHGFHAMTVVGYDNDKFGGAFEIQNSWGRSWRNNGYVWVRYKDFDTYVYGAIELMQLPKPDPEFALFKGGLTVFNLDSKKDYTVRMKSQGILSGIYEYEVQEPVTLGDRLRFYVKNGEPSYVYVLGTGSVKTEVAALFPGEGQSPLLNYSDNELPLPGEDLYFGADSTVGTDYLILIYTKEALNLQEVLERFNTSTESIQEKIKNEFGDRLIPLEKLKYSKEAIQFEAFGTSNSEVMALVISFNHI